jgi:hypothetical protein
MINVKIEAVPELTTDRAALTFARRLGEFTTQQPKAAFLVLDFSTSEPSPTKYNVLAESITQMAKSLWGQPNYERIY